MDTSTSIPLGRYLLGEKLATGGMGEVYVALQRGNEGAERPLAIKLLLPHLIEEAQVVKMFLDEARLCARMSHPNIVQILDLGREEGRYFLAMELVRGVSLVRLVRVLAEQKRTLSAPLMLHVARSLLDALHYAHTLKGADGKPLGLVHRDVTPHNILVSMDGEVKLTDFGIAKVQAAVGQTRPGVVRGKMDYLAPEQLRFERLDSRVDLFAAGLTLVFMATGRSPFARNSTQETLKAVQNEPLPLLEVLRPDLPRPLLDAIVRATDKDPNRRFPTARAFREALPPPTASERAELLGAVVREVCPSVVGTFERASRTLVALNATAVGTGARRRAGTQSMSELVSPPAAPSMTESASKPGTLDMPEPVGGLTETTKLHGTVAAPIVAELDSPKPSTAPYVPRPVEARRDGTLALEPPPPRSRRRQLWMAAAALAGLVLIGLAVAGWMRGAGASGPPSPTPAPEVRQPPPAPPPAEQEKAEPVQDRGAQAPRGEEAPLPSAVAERPSEDASAPGAATPGDATQPPPVKEQPSPRGQSAGGRAPRAAPSPEPRVRPLGGTGYLTVDAVPWAHVIIAGRAAGETPLARLSVPVGSVEVELRNPETGKVTKRRVRIQAGKEFFVKEDLR
jgi:serine/threonine-protein kinase